MEVGGAVLYYVMTDFFLYIISLSYLSELSVRDIFINIFKMLKIPWLITTLYTLNILQLCQLYLNKTGRGWNIYSISRTIKNNSMFETPSKSISSLLHKIKSLEVIIIRQKSNKCHVIWNLPEFRTSKCDLCPKSCLSSTLVNEVSLNVATLLCTFCGCFLTTMTEISRCHRTYMILEAKNIYYPAL